MKKNKDRKAANVLAKIHQTSVEKVQVEIKDIQSNMVENDKEHLGHVLRLLSSQECVQRFVSFVLTICCTCSPDQSGPVPELNCHIINFVQVVYWDMLTHLQPCCRRQFSSVG